MSVGHPLWPDLTGSDFMFEVCLFASSDKFQTDDDATPDTLQMP